MNTLSVTMKYILLAKMEGTFRTLRMEYLIVTLLSIFTIGSSIAQQQPLTTEMLEKSAFRFTINEQGHLDSEAREKWLQWIGENQFVGLAEVHNSAQLSFFTKALLKILNEKGFKHFMMEMGPNTAAILQDQVSEPNQVRANIKMINRKYGKRSSSRTPLIFVNKIEDAAFVEEASRLNYQLWGVDQEFSGSYEMLIDHIYKNELDKNEPLKGAYLEAKAAITKVIHKNKHKGQPVYCWYPSSKAITRFFDLVREENSRQIIEDIRTSWDIYCKSATGQWSNQLRADYMKENFEKYLNQHDSESKVFLKLGGVHLTHGLSHFQVNDMGKYLTEKAGHSGFLAIRHLITYRNGKSNVGKKGWESTKMFLEIGEKDQWTVVDLRPFREQLKSGELVAPKSIEFEITSYDLLLISPDDQYPKVNF